MGTVGTGTTMEPPEARVDVGEEPGAGYVDQDREHEVREPGLGEDLHDELNLAGGELTDDLDLDMLAEGGRFIDMEPIFTVDGEVVEGSWIEKSLRQCARRIIDSPEYTSLHIVVRDSRTMILAERSADLHGALGGLIGGLMGHLHDEPQSTPREYVVGMTLGISSLLETLISTTDRRLNYDLASKSLLLTEDDYQGLVDFTNEQGMTREVDDGYIEPTTRGLIVAGISRHGVQGRTLPQLGADLGISDSQIEKHLAGMLDDGWVALEDGRYTMAIGRSLVADDEAHGEA